MPHDITRLRHVGHVVSDMSQAIALYRRLGFHVPPPGVPALAPREGAAPEPFGAANTHADLSRSFVELVTPLKPGNAEGLSPDALIVPLQASPEKLPLLMSRIGETSAQLGEWRDRFEGLHILMFSSPDVDGTANRLTAAGVGHGGVNTVGRPVETPNGVRTEPVRPGAGHPPDQGRPPGPAAR